MISISLKFFVIKSYASSRDRNEVKNISPLIVEIVIELSKIIALYFFKIFLMSFFGISRRVLPKKIFAELKCEWKNVNFRPEFACLNLAFDLNLKNIFLD